MTGTTPPLTERLGEGNGLRRRDVVAGLKERQVRDSELFGNQFGRGSLCKASTHG